MGCDFTKLKVWVSQKGRAQSGIWGCVVGSPSLRVVLCTKFAGRRVRRLYSLLHMTVRSVASVASGMHPSLRGVVVLVVTRSVALVWSSVASDVMVVIAKRSASMLLVSQSEAM